MIVESPLRLSITMATTGLVAVAVLCVIGVQVGDAPPDYVYCPPLFAAYLVAPVAVFAAAFVNRAVGYVGAFVLATPLCWASQHYLDRVLDDRASLSRRAS